MHEMGVEAVLRFAFVQNRARVVVFRLRSWPALDFFSRAVHLFLVPCLLRGVLRAVAAGRPVRLPFLRVSCWRLHLACVLPRGPSTHVCSIGSDVSRVTTPLTCVMQGVIMIYVLYLTYIFTHVWFTWSCMSAALIGACISEAS